MNCEEEARLSNICYFSCFCDKLPERVIRDRKDLFWFVVSEHSVNGQLATHTWKEPSSNRHVWSRRAIHIVAGRKQDEEILVL